MTTPKKTVGLWSLYPGKTIFTRGLFMNAPCLGKVRQQDRGLISLYGKSGCSEVIPDAFSLGGSIVLMNLCRGAGQLGASELIVGKRCELHTVAALFELLFNSSVCTKHR